RMVCGITTSAPLRPFSSSFSSHLSPVRILSLCPILPTYDGHIIGENAKDDIMEVRGRGGGGGGKWCISPRPFSSLPYPSQPPLLQTYDGHIIGENARDDDMEVNPVRTKELTNIRAASKDENIRLTPPRQMSLEEAMGYVQTGELVEVTPAAIRLRKKELSSSKRKSSRRNQKE
ncbi:unnamed protein product, partial [Closterium sp. NIES-54]